MGHKKTKIVLDADVIIHFIEAGNFSLLPDIFPEYEYIVLDVVYNEVSKNNKTKKFIDNYLHHFPKLKQETFAPKGESIKEYFSLQRVLGKGESACMVYCRDNRDVLGSSNLRDIKDVSVSAMLVYTVKKNIAQVFILERYFFVSICPAAGPGTCLAVF